MKIMWSDGNRTRAVIVSTNYPSGVLEAIARARSAPAVMPTRVEIAEEAADEAQAEAEAEQASERRGG